MRTASYQRLHNTCVADLWPLLFLGFASRCTSIVSDDVLRDTNGGFEIIRGPGLDEKLQATFQIGVLGKSLDKMNRYDCFEEILLQSHAIDADPQFTFDNMRRVCDHAEIPPEDSDAAAAAAGAYTAHGSYGECSLAQGSNSLAARKVRFDEAAFFSPWQHMRKVLDGLATSANQISIFVDIGCNMGKVATHSAGLWPNATVWCVDPVPATVEEYCVALNNHQLRCRQVMISSEDQGSSATIWSSGAAGDLCATSSERGASDLGDCYKNKPAPQPIQVPALTLDAFADAEGIAQIDVLKVAVQGAESLVLSSMPQLLSGQRVRVVIFEYSCRWLNFNPDFQLNLKTTQREFSNAGFDSFISTATELVPITGSCWSDAYEAPSQSLVIVLLHRELLDIQSIRRAYSIQAQQDPMEGWIPPDALVQADPFSVWSA